MVFAVERELTAAVVLGGGGGVGAPGSAAQMDDLRQRGEIDRAAVGAHGCAEIHILAIHEVPLVEESRCFGVAPAHKQAGTADPVDLSCP